MTTPTWNQIAAPNFSAGNDLIAQAMNQLTKATTGFKSIADQYKDTIQKRNLGLIQEYVNSAKTPEELQSEAFQTGLTKLTGNMGGDYDTLAKAQLVDKAYDSLLSRKANQVSIDSNEFRLAQDQLEANQKQAISNIFATNDPDMRQAVKDQAVKDKLFNSSLYLQTLAAELTGKTNQQTYDYNAETWDTRKEALRLGNVSTEHAMKIANRNAATAEKNAQANMLQAEAAAAKAEAERKAKQNEKNPALTLLSGIDKIDAAYNSDLLKPSGDPKVADSLETWWEGKNSYVRSNTDLDNIKTILSTDPKTAKLPGKMQVAIADIAYTTIMNENALGRNVFNTGSAREQAEKAVKVAFDKVETQKNDYLYSQKVPLYRDAVRQQMIQTGSRDPIKAARNVGMNEYEMYRTNIRTPLQNMAESVYESSGSTLPKEQFVDKFIYRSVNKEPVDDLIKPKQEAANAPAQSSSSFLNKLGTGSSAEKVALINEQLKQTNDPMQIAFLENELKKAVQSEPVKQATTTTTSPQNKTGTSLQQAAITPTVNRLISTPLGIATNPPTVKAKPVADPLRQAASEQTPVATSNTAQTRQLTTALAAQEQRMQNRARLSLEAQEALQNGQPFVVPVITAKLEETKPRELTPTEVAQGERMQQAALSRLIRAKLEEKQALVKNVFPNASLTPINKATEPLSNNSIPLIQSLLELPVIKNTAKVTTIAELDALVNKARSSTPNFDAIAFVQSLDIDPLLKEAYLNRE